MTRIDEIVADHLGWGMHFSPELERQYREHHAERSVKPLQSGLMVILLLLIGAALPWLGDKEMQHLNTIVCLFVLAPAVALMILATNSPRFPRYAQLLMSLLALFITLGFQLVQHVGPPDLYARQSVIPTIFVVFGVFTIARLRFWNAVLTAALISAISLLWVFKIRPLSGEILSEKIVYLCFAYVIGLAAAYPTNLALRRDFLLSGMLTDEKNRSEHLLTNVMPASIAQRLKDRWEIIADSHDSATVLFADVVNFTPLMAAYPPDQVVRYLNLIFSEFDELLAKHGLEKIKTVGDAYMAAGGLPDPLPNHLAKMADFALEIQDLMSRTPSPSGNPMQLRIGIHTGPLVAGVIGNTKLMYDLWGDTVNTASRMESHGVGGQIQVTEDVVQALKDRYDFQERGFVPVKGKGKLRTYWLIGRKRKANSEDALETASTS
jgi:class 3 adenylate cyclase